MLHSLMKFLSYWYFRYLMVTELYMVERWERAVINISIVLLLILLSYFNYSVLLYYTSSALKDTTVSVS